MIDVPLWKRPFWIQYLDLNKDEQRQSSVAVKEEEVIQLLQSGNSYECPTHPATVTVRVTPSQGQQFKCGHSF